MYDAAQILKADINENLTENTFQFYNNNKQFQAQLKGLLFVLFLWSDCLQNSRTI